MHITIARISWKMTENKSGCSEFHAMKERLHRVAMHDWIHCLQWFYGSVYTYASTDVLKGQFPPLSVLFTVACVFVYKLTCILL